MALLTVSNLSVNYGPIPALHDVSLSLEEGETLAVVGANGAGKSTLGLAIAGAIRPAGGSITLAGEPIAGMTPEKVARKRVALVPEGRHIFEGLTVEENLVLGLTALPAAERPPNAFEAVFSMFPVLQERRSSLGTRLSGGEQQQLAIARALLSNPRLLILDEPSLGLAPLMVDRVYGVLGELKARGVTMLLVEQNPARIGEVADQAIVLANGVVKLTGPASDMLSGDALGAAYLGASEEAAS